jgi:hypothetical protein
MACINDPTDPAHMSPEERLNEVASILSQGILRLHQKAALSATWDQDSLAKTLLETGPDRLDESATSCPYGPRG